MNPPIEVLYLRAPRGDDMIGQCIPAVRYSDHCAVVVKLHTSLESMCGLRDKLVKEIEQLTATCERLQAELTVAKYGQQAVNKLVEQINTAPTGRWSDKPKAL